MENMVDDVTQALSVHPCAKSTHHGTRATGTLPLNMMQKFKSRREDQRTSSFMH